MEEKLAREMARMKMDQEKKTREVEKICAESDEIKHLQEKIRAAYLNKERSAQVVEVQFRKQAEMEEDAHIDKAMLQQKEREDIAQRNHQMAVKAANFHHKRNI